MNSSSTNNQSEQKRLFRSLFDLPLDFFDSCRLLHDGSSSLSEPFETSSSSNPINDNQQILESEEEVKMKNLTRWSCNTCKVEFDSLQDQRSHFKSDLHHFNVKLCIAGKDTIKEEDFDEAASDSLFKDNDISSISGSEDEADKGLFSSSDAHRKTGETNKQKLFICLRTGDVVSIWRSLLMNDNENISYDNDNVVMEVSRGHLKENELIGRLNSFVHEPRDKTHLRIVLLASGGHFAGCVFDGSSVVAHKTFHRYVVRAKAGRKQSSKDASGKAASSAGASLRRYNELALKKEIQELLASWKPYFDASSCVFIYAPSNNRQLLFSGEKPLFSNSHFMIRHFPFTVRRPTCKEAKRMYNHLTVMAYEDIVKRSPSSTIEDILIGVTSIGSGSLETSEEMPWTQFESKENVEACKNIESLDTLSISSDSGVLGTSTLLHKAVMSGNTQETLELLEQGLDPCIKDERGRTPYMLATEKEVRNIFRRFMALNLEKWDWNSAKVPSPLTKEMEELQASKQAEKDAKRKAKAKELKKLRKAKEKISQAQIAPTGSQSQATAPVLKMLPQSSVVKLSKEEELKRAQAAEREKRAAAAEKRIAALNSQSTSEPQKNGDVHCSCCTVSLAGKVPFHRYNYKYCSTSCMHVHRELLEDG